MRLMGHMGHAFERESPRVTTSLPLKCRVLCRSLPLTENRSPLTLPHQMDGNVLVARWALWDRRHDQLARHPGSSLSLFRTSTHFQWRGIRLSTLQTWRQSQR